MLRTELRPYQVEARDRAVAAIQNGGGFALFPEPRCGKTLIALAVAEKIRPSALLIVCPKTAIAVWHSEIQKHLRPRSLGINATAINYEQLVKHRKVWYKQARAQSRLMIICDESHFIKRRGTSRSGTVRHLAGFAKYRLALTGTPIAQGIQDVWAQFDFLDPAIFGTWDEFDANYLTWGGYKKHEIVKYRNEKDFYEKFHAHSFRVTLREARTAPLLIRYSKVYLDLTASTLRVYNELKRDLVTEVNKRKVKVKNVLAAIVKLQQITGGSILSPETAGIGPLPIGREKLDKLHEVVRSLPSRQKFIVVARFLHEIDRIAAFLRRLKLSVAIVRGGEPFDGKFSCDCVVLQIQSGIAVDMAAADTIIFYSTDYSYLNFEQARFRVLSYNKRAAHYYFLLARGTIDEVIYEAISRKKNLAKLVIDSYRNGAKDG